MTVYDQSMTLPELFKQYSGAVAYVSVEDKQGDCGIGTAFHVGEGIFVTARHVIDGKTIQKIATTTAASLVIKSSLDPVPRVHRVEPRVLKITEGPVFGDDERVDVAAFRVGNADPSLPNVPLGTHLDLEIGDDDFVLSAVVIVGYPPVPGTIEPRQIAARGEVNAVVRVRHSPHVHFIVSALPRGGFSGGLVLSETGYALGMVTESLGRNGAPPEVGFMSVLGVEALHRCVAEPFNFEPARSLLEVSSWNLVNIRLERARVAELNSRVSSAAIGVWDDDRDVLCQIRCSDAEILSSALAAFGEHVETATVDSESRPGNVVFEVRGNPCANLLKKAARAAADHFIANGYTEQMNASGQQ